MFEAENIRVYGVSYDSEEQLRTFADGHDVTYDLLSDPDSAVIRKFGILNTLITPDDPEQGGGRSYYGLPCLLYTSPSPRD